MAIVWFFLGVISTIFVGGFIYVANNHYRLRKEDWNGYEAHTVEMFMKGEI